jgi:hypothetical protein
MVIKVESARFYSNSAPNNEITKPFGEHRHPRTYRLSSYPTIRCLENCLEQVMTTPEEANVDVFWTKGSCKYTLNIARKNLNPSTPIIHWKLYGHRHFRAELLWKHETNDIMLIYSLILQQMSQ